MMLPDLGVGHIGYGDDRGFSVDVTLKEDGTDSGKRPASTTLVLCEPSFQNLSI